MRRSWLLTGTLTAAMLVGESCSDSPTEPAPIQATAQGRLERGDSAQIVVTRGGTLLDPNAVQVAISPAAAGHLVAGNWVHFDAAGALTVIVTPAEGAPDTIQLSIAAPPSIVYDNLQSGNRDIWVAALDGGDQRRLTSNAGDDQQPTAAAGKVVFTSFRDGNGELYTVPLAGGVEQRLTTSTANETEPALSSDGLRIAYISNASGTARLWQAASDMSGASIAATGATTPTIEAQPEWSRAGDRIVFSSTGSGNADLYVVTVSSGAVAAVAGANTGQPEVEPAWSADASALLFISNRTTGSGLYRLPLGGTAAALLVAGSLGQPTVLADGRVVFVAFNGSASTLRWIDPSSPTIAHDIPLGAGVLAHPSAVR
jgi:Periplasmic component of the Tol biopolymer transport system